MSTNESKTFIHCVYFTLKEETQQQHDHLVAGCQKYLSDHPGTLHFSAGSRAVEYQRPVNDQEFSVALALVFASEADHETYQTSDRHQEFLAELSDCWSAVRVFDAIA